MHGHPPRHRGDEGTELGLQAALADVLCAPRHSHRSERSPRMFDHPGSMRVMHWHGGDKWLPMAQVDHDVASHDPERAWLKGARLFKCTSCEEQIAIAPDDPDGVGDPNHPHPGV